MSSKPQVTAKIGADASGIQKTLNGVKKSFGGFARDMGAKMKAGAVAGMAGAAAGMAAALKNGFDQKVMLEQSETLMKSLMGGADKAREAMAMLGAEAKENPIFGKKSMVEAGAALANFANGSTKQLQGLVETSQLLSVLNPTQGLEGAAYALKEALGGDYVSLAERFNISKSTIKSMKEAGLEGKALVDAILKQQGVTQDTLGDMGNTMGGQMAKMKAMWDEISLKLIEGFWPRIQQTAQEFLGWIMQNKDQIVEMLTTASEVAVTLIKYAFEFGMALKQGVEVVASYLGAWWATWSANFSLEKFVAWLQMGAGVVIDVAQGLIQKLIAMLLNKIVEMAPNLAGILGLDEAADAASKASGENMFNAGRGIGKIANESGVTAGIGAAKRTQTAHLRIDMSGFNGVPKAMGAS